MEASTVPRARRRLKRRTPKRHSVKISNAKTVAMAMNGNPGTSIKLVLADPRRGRSTHLGVVSYDFHSFVVHREEASVDHYMQPVTGNRLDGQFARGQDRQYGRVAG